MPDDPEHERQAKTPWWLWPHVLSLEAPLVAVLWQMMLARVHRVALMPGTTLGLALAVWLVYVTDRVFDGWKKGGAATDLRHAWYARHRKLVLFVLMPAAVAALAWSALWQIPEGLLWQCVSLAMLVVVYLASFPARGHLLLMTTLGALAGIVVLLVIFVLPADPRTKMQFTLIGFVMMLFGFFQRFDPNATLRLPKEFLGALLFALGSSAGVQFFSMSDGLLAFSTDVLLLWTLFTLNMFGIARVEAEAGAADAQSVAFVWPEIVRLYPLLLIVSLAMCGFILARPSLFPSRASELAESGAISFGLLFVLWLGRGKLSPLSYRALADYALVVPAVRLLL